MKNGLKGVTDATVFCKSMKKGGPASMIQPMKKYAAGGMTEMGASMESTGPIKRKLKRFVRNVKNAIKGNLPQASTPKKRESNCGNGFCWD